MNIRIAKFISSSGYCSRREAEKLILQNKVYINGKLCEHPSQKVATKDIVKVRGKILKKIKKVEIWKMYKPIKYICSKKDKLQRKTIFDLLPKNLINLISVGRLDYMSEGLILFTNSGEYSRFLELPSSNIERVYRVCINGVIRNKEINKVNKGIIIKDIKYKKVKIIVEKKTENHVWLIFKLREGKNREIRNICKFFSWKIIKLIRIGFGPYKLDRLKIGEIKKMQIINND